MPTGVYIRKIDNEKKRIQAIRNFLIGRKFSSKHKEKLLEAGKKTRFKKGLKIRLGVKHTQETKLKMSLAKIGVKRSEEHKQLIRDGKKGKHPPNWIEDRTLLKDDHRDRGGQLHREWSRSVKNRDKWKCLLSNIDCNGKIEAHHILGWTAFPELRYELNNGITLCHFHHPRKRAEEARLSPFFQELIKNNAN